MPRIIPLLLVLPLLAGCSTMRSLNPFGGSGSSGTASGYDLQELVTSAPVFGELVRAAGACQVPVSLSSQDRAARIEQAALVAIRRQGGEAAWNQYLQSVQPPPADPRRRGQDRAAWCGGKRLDIERADSFLAGAEGQRLAERADNARRALGQ